LGKRASFGLPLGVAATYIFIFVLFGAAFPGMGTGAGKIFIDMAYAATPVPAAGGPPRAAVTSLGWHRGLFSR